MPVLNTWHTLLYKDLSGASSTSQGMWQLISPCFRSLSDSLPIWRFHRIRCSRGAVKRCQRHYKGQAVIDKHIKVQGPLSLPEKLPTPQHALLHCSILLFAILARNVAPCFCTVHGLSAGKRLIVFTNLGTLQTSDFRCFHSEQLLDLPAISNHRDSASRVSTR